MSVIVCVSCHVTFGGIARAGQPCALCLEPLIDLHAEVMKCAGRYDPAKESLAVINRALGRTTASG